MRPGSNKARKEAARVLGVTLQARYRDLVEASGTDEIQVAAIALGDLFNKNIEFIVNVLKHYGGMEAKFDPLTVIGPGPTELPLPKTPEIFTAGRDVDMRRRSPSNFELGQDVD